jgi:metalloprotease StcE-like protein
MATRVNLSKSLRKMLWGRSLLVGLMGPLTASALPAAGSVLAALFCGTAQAAEITLTPNSNGGGRLPSGYDKITFSMADGNWTNTIVLPSTPANGAQVLISSAAGYGSSLDATNVDVPLKPLPIVAGDSYQFTYSAAAAKWTVSGSKVAQYTPNQTGAVIPDTHPKLSYYQTWDGNWAPNITLPKTGAEGDIIVIRSRATYGSRITPDNQLYASTTVLSTGDEYVFVFSGYFKRWLLEAAPQRALTAAQATAKMANPTSPRTLVKFFDGNFVTSLTLPASPGDRDRVTLSSTATWSASIPCGNVQGFDSLMLNTGDEYEFMYVAPLAPGT